MAAAEGFLGSVTKLPENLFPVTLFPDQDTNLKLSETLAFALVLDPHCNAEICVPSAEFVYVTV